MTEAQELLYGIRRMAIEAELMARQRDEMRESIAATRSIPTRDPEMNVQTSRDIRDHMGEIAAEIADLSTDLERLLKILEADRRRVRSNLPYLKEDERAIVRLYYLSPVRKGQGARFTSWEDVEHAIHISHTPVARKRRKLIKKKSTAY